MTIEGPRDLVGPNEFPGRQGRLAFAFLLCERVRPVSREEMVEVLWGRNPPRAWDSPLSALVSKLRIVLSKAGLDGPGTLVGAGGCYELRFAGAPLGGCRRGRGQHPRSRDGTASE
jgi:DNA-binding SARP family transcriptional activator